MAALAGRDAASAVREVQAAQQQLGGVLHGEALAGVSRGQVASAGKQLDHAAGRLRRDQRLLSPLVPLAHALSFLPYAGPPLGDAADLLALARYAAEGGAALTHGVDPLLAETERGGAASAAVAPSGAATASGAGTVPPTPGTNTNGAPDTDTSTNPAARLVRALTAGEASLRQGDLLINRAAERRARLHPVSYRGPFSFLRTRIQQLDADLPAAVRHADALALLPAAARTILGFDGPRTYVVLGQDSAELRPTGGFIGSAGLVTFKEGKLVFQEYRSSYDFDNPDVLPLPPPAPLVRYLGAGGWLLRDANWSPDFPTTAKQIEAFVLRDTGVQVDGVIAFDNFAVSDLLTALGPVQVPGFGESVNADNWFALATRTIFAGSDSLVNALQDYQQAKGSGLSAVLQAVLAGVQSAKGHDLLAVVDGLRRASLGNHLLLGLDEPQPAAWARLVRTDGALFPAPDSDTFAAIDASLGYAKVSPYVQRNLTYDAWLDEAGQPLRVELSFTIANTIDAAILADPNQRIGGSRWLPAEGRLVAAPGDFADYLRLYLPAGSTLTSATGLPEMTASNEGGYRVLGGFVPLAPGQTQTVTLHYAPNLRVESASLYRIALIKQAGVAELPVKLTLHLATGTHATALPAEAVAQGGQVTIDTVLRNAVTQFDVGVGKGSGS